MYINDVFQVNLFARFNNGMQLYLINYDVQLKPNFDHFWKKDIIEFNAYYKWGLYPQKSAIVNNGLFSSIDDNHIEWTHGNNSFGLTISFRIQEVDEIATRFRYVYPNVSP